MALFIDILIKIVLVLFGFLLKPAFDYFFLKPNLEIEDKIIKDETRKLVLYHIQIRNTGTGVTKCEVELVHTKKENEVVRYKLPCPTSPDKYSTSISGKGSTREFSFLRLIKDTQKVFFYNHLKGKYLDGQWVPFILNQEKIVEIEARPYNKYAGVKKRKLKIFREGDEIRINTLDQSAL